MPTTRRTASARRCQGDGGYLGDISLPVVLGVGVFIVVVAVLAIRIAYGSSVDESKPRALILGDSITDHGQRELRDTVGPLYALSIEGQDNFRVDEQLPAAERWATRDFQQVVINLGTNDVVQGWPLDQTMASLNKLVSLFPNARCIHVTTINPELELSGPAIKDHARKLNDEIRALPDSNPRVHVVDWAAVVDAEQARGVDVTTDGVHPTQDGQELLADEYERSMLACSGQG
jgi:lysophospholipase L1-like esterase